MKGLGRLAHVLRRPGTEVPTAVRRPFERRLGRDLSRVRIHIDDAAAELGVRAYTLGRHVAIDPGHYRPETAEGYTLLAHELTHAAQQAAFRDDQLVGARVMGRDHPAEREARAGAGHATPLASPAVQCDDRAKVKPAQPGITNPAQSLAQLGITNPAQSPRYIDKLFRTVAYDWFTGVFTFRWQEGGAEKRILVPLKQMEQNETFTFVPVLEPVFDTKAEAAREADKYNRATSPTSGLFTYCFYLGPERVIMPTAFSKGSTPEFFALLPKLRTKVAEEAGEAAQALQPIANYLNPVPFTEVSERGELKVSSNPADILALLKLRRLRGAKKAVPTRTKRHSGHGVRYRVRGPHDKLKGTSVYVLKDADGNVLYVGKGEALDRLREHIKDPKKTDWFGEIAEVEVRATGVNNTEALALEEDLIRQLNPFHNVDRHPFRSVFGNTMEVGPNLPKAQEILRFLLDWGN